MPPLENHYVREIPTAAVKVTEERNQCPGYGCHISQLGVALGRHMVSGCRGAGGGAGRVDYPSRSLALLPAPLPQGDSCLDTQRAWLG